MLLLALMATLAVAFAPAALAEGEMIGTRLRYTDPESGERVPLAGIRLTVQDTSGETVAEGVTLVDFWAEWCGPCKVIAPAIDQIASEYEGSVTVGKVDVDNAADLAERFVVQSIPTLLIMKDGEEAKRFVGVTSKDALAGAIDEVRGA